MDRLQRWLCELNTVDEIKLFEDDIEFVEQIMKSPPEGCLIRLGLNEIPGLMAAEMVHQIDEEIRIIFYSENIDYVTDAYEIGAYGFLLCPINKDKLQHYIKKLSNKIS
jgi:two-component system LytT family response regulator